MSHIFSTPALFAFSRNDVPEVVVHGISASKVQGASVQSNHADVVLATRSLLKPWQFMACEVAGSEPWWSIGLASHSGQPAQMDALASLAAAAGAEESDLMCPRAMPLDATVAASVRVSGQAQRRLHHPCAGKHLVMLAACQKFGWSKDQYWDATHPIQRKVFGLVGKEAGANVVWVTDSCGLPNAAMSLKAMCSMWEKLGVSQDEKTAQTRELWLANPRLVGGQRRLDSDLVEASGRRVLVKEGADGLLVIQSLADAKDPAATCIVKLASGYNPAFLAIAMWSLISRTDGLPKVIRDLGDYLRSRLEEWVPRDQTLMLPPFTTPSKSDS